MSILLAEPPRFSSAAAQFEEQEIRDLVRRALAGPFSPYKGADRRRDKRYPYPYPIMLTPVETGGNAPCREPIVVVGKHLSDRGVDFYCREPLPHRRVIASLECGEDEWVGLVLDLAWCRFTRFGWYENGGRFLGIAAEQPRLFRKTA